MSFLALKIVQALDLCPEERKRLEIHQMRELLSVEILHSEELLAKYKKDGYYPEHLSYNNRWARDSLLDEQEEERKMHAMSCLVRKSRDWRHKI